jgi:hypothetical protein
MWRLCACAVVATLLGGCSSTFFFLPDAPAAPDPAPAGYQDLVAKDLNLLKARLGMGPLEISPVHETRLAQPGDWYACVRTNIQERQVHFAVFMRAGKVIDRREAVVIDGCAQDEFQPLQIVEAAPAKSK